MYAGCMEGLVLPLAAADADAPPEGGAPSAPPVDARPAVPAARKVASRVAATAAAADAAAAARCPLSDFPGGAPGAGP